MRFIQIVVIIIAGCSVPKNTSSSVASVSSYQANDLQVEDIVGVWDMMISTQRGNRETVLTITEDKGVYKGQTEQDAFMITKTGNELSWKSQVKSPRGSVQANYDMSVNGNNMNGTIRASGRTIKARGTRR